jgi:lipid A 3-O-deacylase PagL
MDRPNPTSVTQTIARSAQANPIQDPIEHPIEHWIATALALLLLLALFPSPAHAARLEAIALRYEEAYRKFDGLVQEALTANIRLDRDYFAGNTRVTSRIVVSSGALVLGEDRQGFVSIGPEFTFERHLLGMPTFLVLGIAPTWLGDSTVGSRDLGGQLHFTSHFAMGLRFGPRRDRFLLLRIQHISNGGTNTHNPGVDMAGVELRYALG